MKKIKTNLSSYIKKMKGNLLCIGIEDSKLIDLIDNNNEIKNCDILSDSTDNDNLLVEAKQKKIWIYKLRKVFKKNRFHYIVAPISMLKKYLKTFVRDSIYINSDTIYLYAKKEYDYKRLQQMYNRYYAKFKVEECQDGNIFIIDVKNTRDHPLKNKLYYCLDCIVDTIDMIGDFLSN